MINKCATCDSILGKFDNYGTAENVLCFDCANELKCSRCNKVIPISSQRSSKEKIICQDCIKIEELELQHEKKQKVHANESQEKIIKFITPERVEILLSKIKFPEVYKIPVDFSKLTFISIAMLLPTLGGITELFHESFTNFHLGHFISILSYIVYPFIVQRMLSRRIILFDKNIAVYHFFNMKKKQYSDIERVDIITTPRKAMFAWEKRYDYSKLLVLYSKTGKVVVPLNRMKKSDDLCDFIIGIAECGYREIDLKRNSIHWLLES